MLDKINTDIIKIDDKLNNALEKIKSFMPEIYRGTRQVAKRNSQTMMSLMSLNMIDSGPYRVLSSILAQIDRKYNALTEALFRLSKKELNIQELENNPERTSLENLKLEKFKLDLKSSTPAIGNLIKEIGALQQRYKEVIKNKGINENWTEEDFENAEIEHHIKSIFRNAIRDRMANSCNMGTMEYMEQFGIEPTVAYAMVDGFLKTQYEKIKESFINKSVLTIDERYQFYDDMYHQFRNEYKRAMNRLGLDSVQYAEWLTKEEMG